MDLTGSCFSVLITWKIAGFPIVGQICVNLVIMEVKTNKQKSCESGLGA
jgi:hypothetical protein